MTSWQVLAQLCLYLPFSNEWVQKKSTNSWLVPELLTLILKYNVRVTTAVTNDGSRTEYEQATFNKHAVNDGLR
jgi:hypothetical protein